MKTIVEQIFEHAKECPNKIALHNGKQSYSYIELAKRIIESKNLLKSQFGLKEQDAVIIAADKQLVFVSVYFACHLLGIVALPIAPDTNPKRFELIYGQLNPKLVIGFENECIHTQVATLKEFETGGTKNLNFQEILFPDLDNLADIIFTTGTTGMPKGVTLSQENIAAAARNINTFIQNSKEDVEMLALPISHSFGLGRLRCALSNGQTVIILGSFANMKRFYRFMEEFRVNGFGMVPASWALIKKMSGDKIKEYASQLHYVEIGSAPMPIEDKRLLMEYLPDTRICMHYGLTEASRSCFMEFHEDRCYLDTVGRPSPNMDVVIMSEDGSTVPTNVEGEICVKGLAVTKGYYHLEELNASTFFGDYFRTGDWGVKDAEGRIKLCSRKKELINVGGKKVSPMEVEEILCQLDYIQECACIGIPDPENILGEVVKACVVTNHPEKIKPEEINQFLSDKLENYKIPIAYEVIGDVPKTSSGKIQRLRLKKES